MAASSARVAALLAAATLGATAACTVASPGAGPRAAPSGSASVEQGLPDHVLTQNGLLIGNGTPMNQLLAHPLSTEGLGSQPDTARLLAGDEGARQFFSYLVSCALPSDQTLRITPEGDAGALEFPGGAGVAAEWATGPCDEACQEWVSSCIYARVNRYGVAVAVTLVGTHPTLRGAPDDSRGEYFREGAFYGNLFANPPRGYACRGDGYDPIRTTFRQCAQPGNPCPIQSVGPCSDVDGLTGEFAARRACEGFDADAGAYTQCHNRPTYEGSDEFPPGTTYARSITVYLRRTSYTYAPGGGRP